MDIEQIDLGENFVRTCLQGSGRLVVSFESGGGKVERPDKDHPAWGQGLVANAGWDGLHVLPKIMKWYQAQELWDFFITMKKTGFFEGYKEVVMYGNSMGGFAAMAFAKYCNAKRVVAFHPRSTLAKWVLPWDSAFSNQLTFNRIGPPADALSGLEAGIDVLIFADPLYRRDYNHARRVAENHSETRIIRVPFIMHDIPAYLAEVKLLQKVARSAIQGCFDEAQFYQDIRGRRKSPLYQAHFKRYMLRRGQPKRAVIQHSVSQLGPNPKAK